MSKKQKTRDELLADAIQEGAAGVGGEGGGKGSSVAKRQRKQAAAAANLTSEIRNEAGALSSVFEEPAPIAPPIRGKAVATARAPGKQPAPPTDKAKCLAIRDTYARYAKLVQSNPARYGEIEVPELTEKQNLEELQASLKTLEHILRRRAATNTFRSFFVGLPRRLEELSLQGAIPLNLIGLEDEILGGEMPVMPDFSPADEYDALMEELAIKYDSWFAVSPELRFIGLFASSALQVHHRNMALMQSFGSKNPTNVQGPPDVQPE